MPRENQFQRYVDLRHDKNRTRELEAYEASRLTYLLRVFGMAPQAVRALIQRHVEIHGDPALRFAVFNREHPSFPIVLGAALLRDLHTDPRCFLPNLFKAYDQAPFVAAYEAFFETASRTADGRAVGLVFRRKGVRHGLIMHNGVDLPGRVFGGLTLAYQDSTGKQRLFVQPFQTVVEQLHAKGHGWRP